MKNSYKGSAKNRYSTYSLSEFKVVKVALRARAFQFVFTLPMVLILFVILASGIYGTQNPGANFATVAVWTTWWIGVIFLIILSGSSWCLICPWSAVADWTERISFWGKKEGLSMAFNWPTLLKNRHLATAFFIIVTWLELGLLITYNPLNTAYLAFALVVLAVMTALVFEKKAFCRYVCFVGGIVGMYSNLAPVEIRSKDNEVCQACKSKDCITGNEKGYGCPTHEYPGGMSNNSNCIMCTECFKTCPSDNMSLNLRPLLADVSHGYKGRFDESILILTLLALTAYHGFTMLPNWTTWAQDTMLTNYSLYLSTFTLLEVGFVVAVLFGHLIASSIVNKVSYSNGASTKQIFVQFSYALLPLALFYHLSHNFGHFNMEGLEIVPVISDPLGRGMNIFGTAGEKIKMILGMRLQLIFQYMMLTTGFISSIYLSYKTSAKLFNGSKESMVRAIPLFAVIIIYTVLFTWMTMQPMAMRTS